MAEKIETASEFLRKLGDWARVDSPFGGYRARAAESLIDKRDSAITAAAELRGRLAMLDELVAFDKTALAELREVPSATSANAESSDDFSDWSVPVDSHANCKAALAASEARVLELTGELAWEKAWDLNRKADMQAVVEAAREQRRVDPESISKDLDAALSALDARVEPVTEREIVVGSTWRHIGPERWGDVRVEGVGGGKVCYGAERVSGCRNIGYFRSAFTHVSDPAPPVSESATREG